MFVLDQRALLRSKDLAVRAVLLAQTQAVAAATKGLERDLEKITRLAVRGRLWRAWRSEVYPKRATPAREPRGTVLINGGERSQKSMEFMTGTGRVYQNSGHYFAFPTAAAGSRGRRRDLTPGEWEARTGQRLRFVYRRNGASMLVVDGATFSGKRRIAVGNTSRRRARGRADETIVIFWLVPHLDKQHRFSTAPLITRRERMMVQDFEGRVRRAPALR